MSCVFLFPNQFFYYKHISIINILLSLFLIWQVFLISHHLGSFPWKTLLSFAARSEHGIQRTEISLKSVHFVFKCWGMCLDTLCYGGTPYAQFVILFFFFFLNRPQEEWFQLHNHTVKVGQIIFFLFNSDFPINSVSVNFCLRNT